MFFIYICFYALVLIRYGTWAGNIKVDYGRAARFRLDVIFGHGNGDRQRWVLRGEHDTLLAIPRWEYRDYANWCVGLFDQQCFAKNAFDGNSLIDYD